MALGMIVIVTDCYKDEFLLSRVSEECHKQTRFLSAYGWYSPSQGERERERENVRL
jgi:hypothetical protein